MGTPLTKTKTSESRAAAVSPADPKPGRALLGPFEPSFEWLPFPMVLAARDYRILDLNAAALAMSAASGPAELIGHMVGERLPKLMNAALLQKIDETLASADQDAPKPLFVRFVDLKGRSRSIELRFLAVLGGGGTAEAVLLIGNNVSDREEAREKAEASESLVHSILETVPDGLVVIDEHGIVTSISTAAQRMFRYRESQVVGRNVSMLMPPPYRDEHDGYLARYRATGEKHIIGTGRIVEGVRSDGSVFPIEVTVGEAITAEHRVFAGFVKDLTERLATEAQMEELQSELAHAARLSATGTLASALAHEINQPLTSIANYMAAAGDLVEELPPAQRAALREAMEEAGKEAIRAGQIVRRIRDFVSKGELSREVVPLAKIIGDATTLGLVGAREKGISWSVDIDHVGEALVDRIQIQQVMINLMRNAIEAMADTPRKELAIIARNISDKQIQVSVADTGHGLDPEVLKKLFEPFVSTKARGMGVGLSICRSIVEAHGGKLEVESKPEGGMIFRFTLNRASKEHSHAS